MAIQIVLCVKNSPEFMLCSCFAAHAKRCSDPGAEKDAVDNSKQQHSCRTVEAVEERRS
jgi:hypothetical protein